jgi:hypothetical protein
MTNNKKKLQVFLEMSRTLLTAESTPAVDQSVVAIDADIRS